MASRAEKQILFSEGDIVEAGEKGGTAEDDA